jgi:uncharacterized protein (TIGR03435 family)
MYRNTILLLLFMAVSGSVTPARVQSDPAFEVASVKRAMEPGMIYGIRPVDASGRFYAVITVYDLFRIAYGSPLALVESQVAEAPAWVKNDRFEITAKIDGPLDQNRLGAMIRALLADRFQLRVRKEVRQLPVFDLVLDGGQPGPKLRPANGQCTSIFADAKPDFTRTCGFKRFTSTAISALGISLDGLASGISTRPEVQRVVRNQTGLTGTFDFDLEFMPEPDAPAAAFFTAFREQLGLRFQPATGPLDAYVIERIEPPAPD